MAHFNFSLNDFTSGKNISNAIIGGSKNYTPTGQTKALKTTFSQLPLDKQRPLTTTNVSDLLQGTTVYKPMGLVYNSFNDVLSRDIQLARNIRSGGKLLSMDKSHAGLLPYDANKKDASIDIASSVNVLATSSSSSAGTSTGGASAGGNGNIGGGDGQIQIGTNCPAGIPRGPFVASKRRDNPAGLGWSTDTGVQEITLTGDQILDLLIAAGCEVSGLPFMWAVAKRESSFACNRIGINYNGSTDAGLWQINDGQPTDGKTNKFNGWKGFTLNEVLDPWINVHLAMNMSNNGTRFVPWQTSGNYSTPDGSHVGSVNMEEGINFVRSKGYQV